MAGGRKVGDTKQKTDLRDGQLHNMYGCLQISIRGVGVRFCFAQLNHSQAQLRVCAGDMTSVQRFTARTAHPQMQATQMRSDKEHKMPVAHLTGTQYWFGGFLRLSKSDVNSPKPKIT
jgi:hypothetical protein